MSLHCIAILDIANRPGCLFNQRADAGIAFASHSCWEVDRLAGARAIFPRVAYGAEVRGEDEGSTAAVRPGDDRYLGVRQIDAGVSLCNCESLRGAETSGRL